jgi:hypothetical protein
VDLPYPAQIISASSAQPAKGGDEAAKSASQISAPPQASPHLIKFHGTEGRNGILEWNAERILYSGDMQPESSAKALFDSLWAKSYTCESGRLLSVSDKTTLAPQPLHFRADDSHSAEVYLDAQEGVRYSGNVPVDGSVKPFFEALRSLYQCKNPPATSTPK